MSTTSIISAFAATMLVVGVVFVALSSDAHTQTAVSSNQELPTGKPFQQMASTELFRDTVEYVNKRSNGHISGMGKCSAAQTRKINDGIAQAAPYIRKAIQDPNSEYFTKWFGTASSRQPDSDVYGRMQDALKKMTDHDWTSDCCAASGSTDQHCYKTCQGAVNAFVSSYTYTYANNKESDKEYQYNNINFCSQVFENTAIQLGWIVFHEAIHMVSAASDGNDDYSKVALVKLADNDPEKARLTANNYMLYTMQASLDYKQYEEISSIAGSSVSTDGNCKNKYGNCVSLVENGNCKSGQVGGGQSLSSACCLACAKLQPPGFVACADKYSNCNQLASSANTCSAGTLSSGEVVGTACCKSCKRF